VQSAQCRWEFDRLNDHEQNAECVLCGRCSPAYAADMFDAAAAAGNLNFMLGPGHQPPALPPSELLGVSMVDTERLRGVGGSLVVVEVTSGNGVGCRSSIAIEELDISANFPSRPTSSPTMCKNAGLAVRGDAVLSVLVVVVVVIVVVGLVVVAVATAGVRKVVAVFWSVVVVLT